jgi:hypothetical protein
MSMAAGREGETGEIKVRGIATALVRFDVRLWPEGWLPEQADWHVARGRFGGASTTPRGARTGSIVRKPGSYIDLHPGGQMQKPTMTPVADTAPAADEFTRYDEEHTITYLRLLDAHAAGADWQEATRVILHMNPLAEPDRARRAWETHLARAQWLTDQGYRQLLRRQSGYDLGAKEPY